MGVKGRGSSGGVIGPAGGWADYESLRELELEAESRFGKRFDLSGMSEENARIFLDEYEQFVTQWPMASADIRPGSKALMSTGKGYVLYNEEHLRKGISELNKRISLNPVLAERTFRESVRHEMYHSLHQSMTPVQQAKMHTFLQKTYADAILHEDRYNTSLFSMYAMKQGGSIDYTELHSELSVIASRGIRNKYTKELNDLHKEFFR